MATLYLRLPIWPHQFLLHNWALLLRTPFSNSTNSPHRPQSVSPFNTSRSTINLKVLSLSNPATSQKFYSQMTQFKFVAMTLLTEDSTTTQQEQDEHSSRHSHFTLPPHGPYLICIEEAHCSVS